MHFRIAFALLAFALASAPPVNADDAPPPNHHRPEGFQNNYLEFEPRGLMDLLSWQLAAARNGLPKPPEMPTPQVAPDLAFIHANATAAASMQPAITWIGHATMLAQFGGLNLLTDPVFSERASPFTFVGPKRHSPPGLALAELPHIDAVLISHNHYDHLDDASVRALAAQTGGPPLFVVPLGIKAWMAKRGIANCIELDWWQSTTVSGSGGPIEIELHRYSTGRAAAWAIGWRRCGEAMRCSHPSCTSTSAATRPTRKTSSTRNSVSPIVKRMAAASTSR